MTLNNPLAFPIGSNSSSISISSSVILLTSNPFDQLGTSKPQASSCSTSHSFANISKSHSPPLVLSLIKNSLCCSSVRLSATIIGTSFSPASLHALNRIFPPNITMSAFTTIGRMSNISGKSFIDCTNLINLSSFIKRGLFGFSLISEIFVFTLSINLYTRCKLFLAPESSLPSMKYS